MSVVNNLYREPTLDEYAYSNVLVPFKIEDNSIVIPVKYIDDKIKHNYKFLYDMFTSKYYIRVNRLGMADEVFYTQRKYNDSCLFFINVENVLRAKDLIGNVLNIANVDSMIYDIIIPRFYAEHESWRKIYDYIINCSMVTNFKYEINIHDLQEDVIIKSKRSIKRVFDNLIYNANGEADEDILD